MGEYVNGHMSRHVCACMYVRSRIAQGCPRIRSLISHHGGKTLADRHKYNYLQVQLLAIKLPAVLSQLVKRMQVMSRTEVEYETMVA